MSMALGCLAESSRNVRDAVSPSCVTRYLSPLIWSRRPLNESAARGSPLKTNETTTHRPCSACRSALASPPADAVADTERTTSNNEKYRRVRYKGPTTSHRPIFHLQERDAAEVAPVARHRGEVRRQHDRS